jgi:hypothetical protein
MGLTIVMGLSIVIDQALKRVFREKELRSNLGVFILLPS